MAFTVKDFHDLVRLLEQQPSWRAELRRLVLSDEFLELPTSMRQLAAAQAQTEARVDKLAEQVAALAAAQVRTQEQLAALTARVDGLAQRLDDHERRNALDFQVLKDGQLTQTLAARPGVFHELVEEPQPLGPLDAHAWLSSLLAQGQLPPTDYQDVVWADLLVRGRREGQMGYLVIEASWTIGPGDIDRATRRAGALARAGVPAWPAVVGYRVSEQAEPRLVRQEVLTVILPE